MAQLTFNGPDIYIEDRSRNSPRITLDRKTRKIEREMILLSESPTTFVDIDSALYEMFPPYSIPGRYPAPGSIFFCETASIEAFTRGNGALNGVGTSEGWRIRVTYAPLDFGSGDNQQDDQQDPMMVLLERNTIGGGEYLTIPGQGLAWEGDTKPIMDEGVQANVRITLIQHSFTRHKLRPNQIPYEAMRALAGKVNAVKFPTRHPLFPGIGAEQLMFEDWNINFQFAIDGSYEYKLGLNFRERTGVDDFLNTEGEPETTTITWNHLWDKRSRLNGGQRFRKMYRDKVVGEQQQKKTLYPTAKIEEFNAVFR